MGKPLERKVNTLLTYYQTKKYIEAEKLAKLIIFEFPENIFAWRVLSFVLKKNGKTNAQIAVGFQRRNMKIVKHVKDVPQKCQVKFKQK